MRYGSVLHGDPALSGVHMRPIRFPKPMFGLAVRPARRGDESRMSEVLANFSNVNKGIGSLIVLSQQYAVMPDLIAYSLLAIVVSFAFDFASFLFRQGAKLIENRKELSEKKDDRLE